MDVDFELFRVPVISKLADDTYGLSGGGAEKLSKGV